MKKVCSLILVLLMLASLCACGQDAPTDGTAAPTTPSVNTTVHPTAAPTEPTAEPTTPATKPCSHTYESTVTQAPTCTATGVNTFTCSGCGDSYTEQIPMADHDYTAATCTEGSVCTQCGAAGAEASGHERVNGVCKHCGHSFEFLMDLWPASWSIVKIENGVLTRVEFVLLEDGGNVNISTWSTTEGELWGYFYYEGTEYYPLSYGNFSTFTIKGDEYKMTLKMDNGSSITIERTAGDRFTVTAVSGTIIDKVGTAMVTVGSELIWGEMYN